MSAASGLQAAFQDSYVRLAKAAGSVKLVLVTYYDDVEEDVYRWAVRLPVSSLHLDFLGVRGEYVRVVHFTQRPMFLPDILPGLGDTCDTCLIPAFTSTSVQVPGATFPNRNLEWIEKHGWPVGLDLGAGIVDGRSIWADRSGARGGSGGGGGAVKVAVLLTSFSRILVYTLAKGCPDL